MQIPVFGRSLKTSKIIMHLYKKVLIPVILLLISIIFFYGFRKKNISFKNIDTSEISRLKQGFINPPSSALPGVYWYFMDGNMSKRKEVITSMRKTAGIIPFLITVRGKWEGYWF